MKRVVKWLSVGLVLLLLAAAFRQAAELKTIWPGVSLRYDTPVTREQVETAREYAEAEKGPYLTFWGESAAWVSTDMGSVQAEQIIFSGEADQAFPGTYVFGTAPSVVEKKGCAVSSALAWGLWGGENVTGLELSVEGENYLVTGVFEDEDCRLIRPADGGFTAVEVSGIPDGVDSYRYARDYAVACGLDLPDEILWGRGFAALAAALPWIPLGLACVKPAWQGIRKYRQIPRAWRGVIFFCAAFLLALFLPRLLEAVPAWLVPTRLSDFDFWTRLAETFLDRFRDLLSLTPLGRDVAGKMGMVKLLALVLAASVMAPKTAK